jgi:integrase
MRRIGRLSARQVKNAKPKRGDKKTKLPDGGNLYLQCTRAAADDDEIRRSWVFLYQQDFKRHELGLGATHTVSLREARDKAHDLRQQLLKGISPLVARRQIRQERLAKAAATVTFRECCRMLLAAKSKDWTNRKHAAQWQSTLESTYPVLGDLAVSDIDTPHILKVLEPMWQRTPESASRLRGRIEAVLGLATVRGFRTGDNPARWKNHLALTLSTKKTVGHHAALPFADMPKLVAELRGIDALDARALEFLICVAARAGEVIGATWDEINLPARTWVIPATRMKAGKEHRVFLSDRAVEILSSLPRRGERVFELEEKRMRRLLNRLRPGVTVHGCRSSFADWCHEATNFPHIVIEQALAHGAGTKVERAYRRGDLFEKRRRLMAEWARYLAKPLPVAGATVTQLAGRR